ncbi:MAG TPA: M23 family metallopeptidase [bacterium]|nr:M23 family metallopeptidase [bacterium]
MNPAYIKYIAAAFSMKQEIKIFFISFLAICLIPLFIVIILTQAGFSLISDTLAVFNPQSLVVDILDPVTGEALDHINTTAAWPVNGPVSLEFGEMHLPYQPYHTGIDIATTDHQIGDPVIVFMEGKVTKVESLNRGFGNHVVVDHGHHLTSIYAHLDSISVVKDQEIAVGTIVGTRGSTGWSTGPHLHFQINVFGIPVNPRTFLTGEP